MALRLHLWWDRCIYSWHQWLDLKHHLQWDPFAGPRALEGDTSGGDYTFGAGKCGPGHLWVATCLKVFQENWGKLTVSEYLFVGGSNWPGFSTSRAMLTLPCDGHSNAWQQPWQQQIRRGRPWSSSAWRWGTLTEPRRRGWSKCEKGT